MKKTKLITIMAIIFIAASCKKEKNSGDTTGQEILTMKVNGVDWVGDDNLAGFKIKTNNKANFGGRQTSSDETLSMNNVEVTATGSYTINKALSQNFTFLKDGASPKLYSVSTTYPKSRATFVVTKINEGTSLLDNLEGTFSGVLYHSATDSVVITNGVFKFN
ncbi:MAG: DUF5025 domain-containing protein [Chitinophagales bacterium]|nr:DUF5025 domain-containing protein [Chitinophagales bacterium]